MQVPDDTLREEENNQISHQIESTVYEIEYQHVDTGAGDPGLPEDLDRSAAEGPSEEHGQIEHHVEHCDQMACPPEIVSSPQWNKYPAPFEQYSALQEEQDQGIEDGDDVVGLSPSSAAAVIRRQARVPTYVKV
jgi:hypothetical protein